jgi:hypothetical protein
MRFARGLNRDYSPGRKIGQEKILRHSFNSAAGSRTVENLKQTPRLMELDAAGGMLVLCQVYELESAIYTAGWLAAERSDAPASWGFAEAQPQPPVDAMCNIWQRTEAIWAADVESRRSARQSSEDNREHARERHER